MTIQELQEQRSKAVADMQAIHNLAEKENRSMNDTERESWEKANSDIDSLAARIADSKKLEARSAELDAVADNAVVPQTRSVVTDDEGKVIETRSVEVPELYRKVAEYRKTEEYRDALSSYIVKGERGLNDSERRALSVGTQSEGGYTLAAEDFLTQLIQRKDDQVSLANIATKYMLHEAKEIRFPTLAQDPSDPVWTSELATGDEDSDMAFGELKMQPAPLAKRLKISKTLIRESALPVESIIQERLAYKMAVAQENAILNGDGASNKPAGLFNTAGLAVGRDIATGNTATAITYEGLMETVHGLKKQHRSAAKFLVSDAFVKQARLIRDANDRPLWQPGMVAGAPDTIFGHEVIVSDFAPDTFAADAYVGIFGDFSYYYIVETLNYSLQILDELYAETNQRGYIIRSEMSGKPALEEAFVRTKLAS